jgi:hypothetical protein
VLDLPPFAMVMHQCGYVGGLCVMICHSRNSLSGQAPGSGVEAPSGAAYVLDLSRYA